VKGVYRVKTPILETDRLILRPFCMEDVQEVFECWESDPEVAKYMFWTSHNDINKKAWGFGYTTEAMQKVIKFCKEQLEIKEIMGRHAKENLASGRILEKLGFTYIKDIQYECNRGKDLYAGKEYILKL